MSNNGSCIDLLTGMVMKRSCYQKSRIPHLHLARHYAIDIFVDEDLSVLSLSSLFFAFFVLAASLLLILFFRWRKETTTLAAKSKSADKYLAIQPIEEEEEREETKKGELPHALFLPSITTSNLSVCSGYLSILLLPACRSFSFSLFLVGLI